ncbi:DUF6255 family natural product biosynthesis protein [Streptomyces roseoverticillatus]|uniref:DUF6255 family natural product biosynthesis protein n=1 Tax=Streptomyces roseoverticillatus TaxID=66429 RepID=UPI0037BCD51A
MTARMCTHRAGWTTRTRGEVHCRGCGTVRFTDYGALRPPGLPHAVAPKPRDARRADRAAATWIVNLPRKRVWWGLVPVGHSAAEGGG